MICVVLILNSKISVVSVICGRLETGFIVNKLNIASSTRMGGNSFTPSANHTGHTNFRV